MGNCQQVSGECIRDVDVGPFTYTWMMGRQPISKLYLGDERIVRRKGSVAKTSKVRERKRRFAVAEEVLSGVAPLHEISKKGNSMCGAALPGDFSIILTRPPELEWCPDCVQRSVVAAQDRALSKARDRVLSAKKPRRTKAKKKKGLPGTATSRAEEAARRGMKSWRSELYPGESADRNSRPKGSGDIPSGAPSLGKRR